MHYSVCVCVCVAGEREGWSAHSGGCAEGVSCCCWEGAEDSVSSAGAERRGGHTSQSREQCSQVRVCLWTTAVDRHFCLSCLCLNMCHPECVCVYAFRLLQEQMEQSLSDVQHRLSVKTNELQAAHQQIDKLEEKISACISLCCTLLIYSNAHLYANRLFCLFFPV